MTISPSIQLAFLSVALIAHCSKPSKNALEARFANTKLSARKVSLSVHARASRYERTARTRHIPPFMITFVRYPDEERVHSVGIWDGCNKRGAKCRVSGDTVYFAFGNVAGTKKLCRSSFPYYAPLLGDTVVYRLNGDTLALISTRHDTVFFVPYRKESAL